MSQRKRPEVTLTPKQRELLAEILRDVANAGRPPTLQELADRQAVCRTTIYGHIQELLRKGVLKQVGTGARCYWPVGRCPTCGQAWAGK